MVQGRYVFPFSQLRMTDVDRVGGKNASLGELLSQLTSAGIRVPVLKTVFTRVLQSLMLTTLRPWPLPVLRSAVGLKVRRSPPSWKRKFASSTNGCVKAVIFQ